MIDPKEGRAQSKSAMHLLNGILRAETRMRRLMALRKGHEGPGGTILLWFWLVRVGMISRMNADTKEQLITRRSSL
jgi:hypothetical protein